MVEAGQDPATRVPGARSTPTPDSRTVPAKSIPSPTGVSPLITPTEWKNPDETARSTGLIDAAATATRTSPSAGCRTGMSTISIESGPDGVVTTAARKVSRYVFMTFSSLCVALL